MGIRALCACRSGKTKPVEGRIASHEVDARSFDGCTQSQRFDEIDVQPWRIHSGAAHYDQVSNGISTETRSCGQAPVGCFEAERKGMPTIQFQPPTCTREGFKVLAVLEEMKIANAPVIVENRVPGIDTAGAKQHPQLSRIVITEPHGMNHELRDGRLIQGMWRIGRADRGDKTHYSIITQKRLS